MAIGYVSREKSFQVTRDALIPLDCPLSAQLRAARWRAQLCCEERGLRGMLAPLKAHVIDAQSLDADLMRVLQGMWSEVYAQAGTRLSTSLQPELDGLLRGALWYLSMWRCSATLGQQMQNLHCVAANSAHLPEARTRSGAALELATPSLKASDLPAAVVPRDRRLLFGLLTVLLPWAWSRASRAMADPDHPERLRW